MELKYIKTFKAIVEAGSFQKAAEILNYSQSTITFQIQQLEQELSIKLFEKIGRKMILTDIGKSILPHIDEVLEKICFIESYCKGTKELSGELTVAIPESFLTYKSQVALKLFRQQAPNVKLSIQMGNCIDIREQIMNGYIDFGLHYDVGGYNSSTQIEKLGEYEIDLVCSPSFQERDFITKHQRKRVCLLTDDKNSIFFSIFSRYLAEQDIVMDSVLELGSIETIKRSVASNIGVAALPRFTVKDELENGTLNTIEISMEQKKIVAICVFHKNKWISPAMKRFISLIKTNV